MKEVNPQKLHMDICGINKKYKLELTNPTVDELKNVVYQRVKKLHVHKYPYNDFLYHT